MSDNRTTQDYQPVTFAQLGKLILNDIENSSVKSSIMTKYNKEKIVRFLENPEKFQKELRQLSNYLYNNSPNYKRLISYFSNMLRFGYTVEPYDLNIEKVNVDSFKRQYFQTLKLLDIMNFKHEFNKILKVAFKEDVFYGYEHIASDSYFIQKLNPDYCQISSIEDGVYNFKFDFSYFDKNKDSLKSYPDEFNKKYKKYVANKKELRWQELDSNNTICIKINEEIEYPLPPFNTVFESVFDIDETKRMRTIKTKMDNYMILTQQIPIADNKDSEPNKFLIDLDTAIAFHNRATEALPAEVGLVTSPMKIEAIKLERKNNDADYVAQAERDYYNASGVSQLLFNGDKSTTTSLGKSITTDEQIAFSVLNQFERWVNRKLKNIGKSYKFRVSFLRITEFNYKEIHDMYLKSAQGGLPVRQELAASIGLSPSALINKAFLEIEVLGLHDKLIPLASSHTQTSKDNKGGAPVKDEVTENGEKTRENDSNNKNKE